VATALIVPMLALAAVGAWTLIGLAQHDPTAANTRLADLSPVDGRGGEDISGPYEVVPEWPHLPDKDKGWVTGRAAGLIVDSPDRIIVAVTGQLPVDYQFRAWGPTAIPKMKPITAPDTTEHGRWEHPVMVFNREGKMIDSWQQWKDTIKTTQRIQVNPFDPEKHVWLTSNGILKFTNDGKKLVMHITSKDVPPPSWMRSTGSSDGARAQSGDAAPAASAGLGEEFAFMPAGDFYVCNGSRVIHFSKDGKYIGEFGKPGTGPGEFQGLHGIVIDHKRQRMYLADRTNSRIQVVDMNGKFIQEWPHMPAPYCIRLTKDGKYLWLSDGFTQKVLKYDVTNGKLITSWGTFGTMPGALWGPHYFSTDSEGNLYVAEDYNARLQKFRPRKDTSHPEQLIGDLQ
jgi:hypothetical protein